jgi:hypothetical protein
MVFYRFFQEKEVRKKYFLGLTSLISILSFLVLFVVADSLVPRYFIHLFFIPFLFLGIFIEYAKRYSKKVYVSAIVLFFGFLISSNVFTIDSEAKAHFAKARSASQYVVLGEIEPMVDYMITNTSGKEAYFTGNNDYFWNYYKPLMYISSQRGFTLIRGEKINKVPAGVTLYAISRNTADVSNMEINYHKIIDYKNFGNLGLYRLEN